MKRISLRLDDHVHAALTEELKEWQKLRGPKFSLNNLCEEKLSTPFPPTQWVASNWDVSSGVSTGTSGNVTYVVTTAPPVYPTIQEPEKKNAKKRK